MRILIRIRLDPNLYKSEPYPQQNYCLNRIRIKLQRVEFETRILKRLPTIIKSDYRKPVHIFAKFK